MNHAAAAVISLSKWLDQVGVTPCTAWRWRKKGWLKTVNIAGRQYLTQESIEEFHHRASAGEFAQVHKVPREPPALLNRKRLVHASATCLNPLLLIAANRPGHKTDLIIFIRADKKTTARFNFRFMKVAKSQGN